MMTVKEDQKMMVNQKIKRNSPLIELPRLDFLSMNSSSA